MMMFKPIHPVITLLTAFTLSGAALAQSQSPPAEAKQGEAPVSEMTCADVLLMYEDAKPQEGVSAEELEKARAFALEFTLWVNGYLTGKHGIDLKERPFEKEGLHNTAVTTTKACDTQPEAKFIDVLPKL
jgi:hypothetical protein